MTFPPERDGAHTPGGVSRMGLLLSGCRTPSDIKRELSPGAEETGGALTSKPAHLAYVRGTRHSPAITDTEPVSAPSTSGARSQEALMTESAQRVAELLPCPFCGSAALTVEGAPDERHMNPDTLESKFAWAVFCASNDGQCGVGPAGKSPEQARELWNRRALGKPAEPVAEYIAAADAILAAPPNPANIKTNRKDEDGYSVYEAWARRCARAIKSLTTPAANRAAQEDDRRDAERYRWLRSQHENGESACTFSVFAPDSEVESEATLYPVGCIPGELDAAIDAALRSRQEKSGG